MKPSASARADVYAHAKASATRKAYAADWRHFESWCAQSGLSALPAERTTVGLYLAALADSRKPATLSRRLAAIAATAQGLRFRVAGLDASRRVSSVLQGIKRTRGTAPNAKAPVLVDNLRAMVRKPRPGVVGTRDDALLLLGCAGAFRRSELVALDVTDVQFTSDGLVVMLRRSKTDQEGEGRKVGIPYGSKLTPARCAV